jgi:hypothetical protein
MQIIKFVKSWIKSSESTQKKREKQKTLSKIETYKVLYLMDKLLVEFKDSEDSIWKST